MIDLSQFASVGGLAVLVGLFVGLIKPSIPKPAIPSAAVVTGIVLGLVVALGLGQLGNRSQVIAWIFTGAMAGFSATGAYEVVWDKLKARSGTGGGAGG